MDKGFWQAIVDTDFAVPNGESLPALTRELLSLLGSTDAELRDTYAYPILCAWLHRGEYSPDEMRSLVAQLAENLMAGLGDEETDTVFLRTFSVLILAEIVHEDNQRPFLAEAEAHQLFELALAYLAAENDVRGWVPGKGWAHSVAHTGDLLWVLARSRYLGGADLERLLDGIAIKLLASAAHPFLCDEDERLAQPVIAVLQRNLVSSQFVGAWITRLAQPAEQRAWADAFLDGERLVARVNVKQFLRSLYLQLMLSETMPASAAEIVPGLRAAVKSMSEWYIQQ
jgi:hypothetical protein